MRARGKDTLFATKCVPDFFNSPEELIPNKKPACRVVAAVAAEKRAALAARSKGVAKEKREERTIVASRRVRRRLELSRRSDSSQCSDVERVRRKGIIMIGP